VGAQNICILAPSAMREKAIVVARGSGRATLVFTFMPLRALAPLNIYGIIGFDEVDEKEAVVLAQQFENLRTLP
jgi:hypothetical protein